MKKIIFILVIIASCIGCRKEDSFISSTGLIGEWSWISTCGGIAEICYTPKSTNQRIDLVLSVDSMYKSIINDTLKDSGRFHVYKFVSDDLKDTSNILQYGSASEMYLIIHDTLYFTHSDLCFDCFASNYKRIK
jgi:hypothetical protein